MADQHHRVARICSKVQEGGFAVDMIYCSPNLAFQGVYGLRMILNLDSFMWENILLKQ